MEQQKYSIKQKAKKGEKNKEYIGKVENKYKIIDLNLIVFIIHEK